MDPGDRAESAAMDGVESQGFFLLQPRPPPNPWAKAPADVRTVAMMQTRTSRRRVLWSSPGKDMIVAFFPVGPALRDRV